MPLSKARQALSHHERLMQHVKKDEATGCWLWTGCLQPQGYGIIRDEKRAWRTHRRSWALHRGPIPTGLHVLHKCDVRHCVNPDHLFLGTHQDNMNDMAAKQRRSDRRGEKAATAILDSNQVLAIRGDRRPRKQIAAAYGVHPDTIRSVQHKRNWKHL